VLKRNILEFYLGRDLYQTRFTQSSSSARKWQEAVDALGRARSAGAGGGEARPEAQKTEARTLLGRSPV
jgi:hypothetical protein